MTADSNDDVPVNTAERAIWGLVDDLYGVAARTPGITDEQAWKLSRTPDMGDPSVPLDDAVAYLTAPPWGAVFARYYTNATLDSAERLTTVYDVVRPSAEQLRAAKGNPFRVFSALPKDRVIERTGQLDAPTLAPEVDESARLSKLLLSEDEDTLADVLAAVLAGGPTLWTSTAPVLQTLEAIVLLLPVELRPLFTFQSYTLNTSNYQPRLTVAGQHLSAPKKGGWFATLPRDRGQLPDAARAAARSLIGLASDMARFQRVQRVYSRLGNDGTPSFDGLLPEVQRLLRLEQFNARRDQSDASACIRLLATATADRERTYMATELTQVIDAKAIADGAADAMEQDAEVGWCGIWRLVGILLPRSAAAGPERDALTALASRIAHVADLPDTSDSGMARTALAVFAARAGLADAMVALALESPDAAALQAIGGRDVVLRHVAVPLAPVAKMLFIETPPSLPGAVNMLDAFRTLRPALTARHSLSRSSSITLGAVRRALATSPPVDGDGQVLLRSLEGFWNVFPPEGDLDRALRTVITGAEATRADADGARAGAALVANPAGPGAAELVGWARLLLSRDDGTSSARTRAAALLEQGKSLPELATAVGGMLRSIPEATGAAILDVVWLRIVALADSVTASSLLVEALAQAIDGVVNGADVGPVTDACVALADQGIVLRAPLAVPALSALGRLRARGNYGSAALRLRLCCAALENVGDETIADRIAADIWNDDARDSSDRRGALLSGRYWLIASALRLMERVRPVREMGLLSDAARASSEWQQRLPKAFVTTLSQFLKLPRKTPSFRRTSAKHEDSSPPRAG